MRLFSSLYDKTLALSRHKKAPWYLGGLSFAESSFFPIPPDVMLAPMSLALPQKAWQFAFITTIASVCGGALGYVIGIFAFHWVEPMLLDLGYHGYYLQARQWFADWGFWAIFVAGFSPIPYKIFTITAGVVSMSFLPFVVASFIGRGSRFFLVSALMVKGGEKMEKNLRKYIDTLGWLTIAMVIIAIWIYKT